MKKNSMFTVLQWIDSVFKQWKTKITHHCNQLQLGLVCQQSIKRKALSQYSTKNCIFKQIIKKNLVLEISCNKNPIFQQHIYEKKNVNFADLYDRTMPHLRNKSHNPLE